MILKAKEFSHLVDCVIACESSWVPHVVSGQGAEGLMQLMPATGAEEAGRLGLEFYEPFNPLQNRFVGSSYLSDLLIRFDYPALALAAYNWGSRNVSRLLNDLHESQKALGVSDVYEAIKERLPKETSDFVSRVLALFESKESV